MDEGPDFQVDRRTLIVTALDEEPDDRAYWLSKSPSERWQAIEMIRQVIYGYRDPSVRLQRVLEIVEREHC